MVRRWLALLAGLWAGLLLGVAAIATPAAFALLPAADAGRVAARILAQEAWASLALAAVLWLLATASARRLGACVRSERRLLWATAVCTGLGYFGVQWLLPAARAGQGAFSFAQLHLFSTLCFALKAALVLALCWRATAGL